MRDEEAEATSATDRGTAQRSSGSATSEASTKDKEHANDPQSIPPYYHAGAWGFRLHLRRFTNACAVVVRVLHRCCRQRNGPNIRNCGAPVERFYRLSPWSGALPPISVPSVARLYCRPRSHDRSLVDAGFTACPHNPHRVRNHCIGCRFTHQAAARWFAGMREVARLFEPECESDVGQHRVSRKPIKTGATKRKLKRRSSRRCRQSSRSFSQRSRRLIRVRTSTHRCRIRGRPLRRQRSHGIESCQNDQRTSKDKK
jgi:hypothetical protein